MFQPKIPFRFRIKRQSFKNFITEIRLADESDQLYTLRTKYSPYPGNHMGKLEGTIAGGAINEKIKNSDQKSHMVLWGEHGGFCAKS